jgi:hypothetical protein
MEKEIIIGDVRDVAFTEHSDSRDPAVRIPTYYKVMFAVQLISLAVVAAAAYGLFY